MSGVRAVAVGRAPIVRHAALVTAMLAIAAAVAVAVSVELIHAVHVVHESDPAHHRNEGVHLVFDPLCIAAAVGVAVLLLAALAVASVPPGRRPGSRQRSAWADPGRGALANASVWATMGALAVGAAAEAFAPLPGGHVTACALIAGSLGAVTGTVHRRAHHQPAYRSFNMVAMLLAAGCLASMSLTSTGEWWVRNFSTLGTSGDFAAACFNLALILSGGAMAAMAGRLAGGLARPEYGARRGAVATVRVLVAVIGLSLAGVGLVPINTEELIHNVFASAAGASFFLLASLTPWLVRRMPRRLVATSWFSLATEVGVWVIYDRLGLASLTVFEVVAFALVFVWLIALVVTTHPAMLHEPAARSSRTRAMVRTSSFAVGGPTGGMVSALARSS
ncbi:hypothetical protein BCL57_000697 [Agromyces flavus]|uniref:DUF998 domain-containing protein n=1 Tax=Agromyces flavus TaxID=589382 RepID=A0A1H1Y0L7_9MICO|nr:DUF998 domain-containing protein [Agromyces flavus]MCP2366555.1 hypothetical protein [Agromyces flavus]GGI44908.1 hypothetical protein GCM10010932_06970 [Agromyces flavus]SDT14972.1 hypothetical protein SAMN04489721_2627 [Agromyces flavus]